MDSCSKYFLLLFVTMVSSQEFVSEKPSSMILGLESGQILRCQFNKTDKCKELKSEDEFSITSLAVSGEFVYLGSNSGSLQRCSLNNEATDKNCVTFHNESSEINALIISGKYVYAGLMDGVILQCGLRKSESCSVFYEADASIYSLATTDDFIYAGSEYEILRCRLNKSDNCTILYNGTSAVSGLIVTRNYIYCGLREGEVWRCDLNVTNCSRKYTAESEIETIDVFDEYLHMVLDSGDVMRCNLEHNESCSVIMSRNESRILSMVSIYATVDLRRRYRGEGKSCVWQGKRRCPPYVTYYSIEDRVPLELHVKNNTIYSSNGNVFDTTENPVESFFGGTAMFVMDPTGRIYVSNEQVIGLLHHSSLLAGNPVSAAGEMKVVNGEIKGINTCSGHYWPSVNLTRQIEKALLNKGYDKNVTVKYCLDQSTLMDVNFNKLILLYFYDLKLNLGRYNFTFFTKL